LKIIKNILKDIKGLTDWIKESFHFGSIKEHQVFIDKSKDIIPDINYKEDKIKIYHLNDKTSDLRNGLFFKDYYIYDFSVGKDGSTIVVVEPTILFSFPRLYCQRILKQLKESFIYERKLKTTLFTSLFISLGIAFVTLVLSIITLAFGNILLGSLLLTTTLVEILCLGELNILYLKIKLKKLSTNNSDAILETYGFYYLHSLEKDKAYNLQDLERKIKKVAFMNSIFHNDPEFMEDVEDTLDKELKDRAIDFDEKARLSTKADKEKFMEALKEFNGFLSNQLEEVKQDYISTSSPKDARRIFNEQNVIDSEMLYEALKEMRINFHPLYGTYYMGLMNDKLLSDKNKVYTSSDNKSYIYLMDKEHQLPFTNRGVFILRAYDLEKDKLFIVVEEGYYNLSKQLLTDKTLNLIRKMHHSEDVEPQRVTVSLVINILIFIAAFLTSIQLLRNDINHIYLPYSLGLQVLSFISFFVSIFIIKKMPIFYFLKNKYSKKTKLSREEEDKMVLEIAYYMEAFNKEPRKPHPFPKEESIKPEDNHEV
jgi:hypothetical protein